MRALLLHPDDAFQGARKRERWDLIIDLGRAPQTFYEQQSAKLGCPVFSIFDLAVEIEDLQSFRSLLRPGMGHVVDRYGIDWWDVISTVLQPDLQSVRLALRLAGKLRGCSELMASRTSLTADVLGIELGIGVQIIQALSERLVAAVRRRGASAANLGLVQLRQVLYDKYDPHYLWRKKWAPASKGNRELVVLLPSAYSNVTRTALSYARGLPEQKFLLVLARESAAVQQVPANVETAMLASFAARPDRDEGQELEARWDHLDSVLREIPLFRLAAQAGILKKGKSWLRWGVTVRDAWLRVFETHSIASCLSADDSNPYTRIPLLLAERRGRAAVCCHHGAMDCRLAFKNHSFSSYLAKGDMERDYLERVGSIDAGRIVVGAPSSAPGDSARWDRHAPWIVFFTEPFEAEDWRVETVYREILPRLCGVARSARKTVVLKLHPFESARQRRRLVARILNSDERRLVRVIDTPLSAQLLQKTWCGLTVESTVAVECASWGIPMFLCGWLRNAYTGYVPQYARYGVGQVLESAEDVARIPELLRTATAAADQPLCLLKPISPGRLSELLSPADCGAPQPAFREATA